MYNYTARTNYQSNKCIQVWILIGYPINTGITLPRGNWNGSPLTPGPPPLQWVTFLIFISQKNIFKRKICKFLLQNGSYTCLISVFLNNKRANYQFRVVVFFFIIKISQIGFFWSQITIIVIEISLNSIYIQNIYEITLTHAGWAWKFSNLMFCHFWKLKNSSHTKTFKYMSRAQFSS